MKNKEWLIYTYKHRRMFVYITHKYIKTEPAHSEMLKRAQVHDLDKMLMYLFMDQVESQMKHIQTKPHHLESGMCESYYDKLEMVIDYECAPYTKPDKPLCAYDFLNKLCELEYVDEETAKPLFNIMSELGIAKSHNVVTDDLEGMMYAERIAEPSEEEIIDEIRNYVNQNADIIPFTLRQQFEAQYGTMKLNNR